MKKIFLAISYVSAFFLALLLFMALARDEVVIPGWAGLLGRFHPMLVHFPIVLLLVQGVGALLLNNEERLSKYRFVFGFWLHITALMTILSSLAGLLLSAEAGYDDTTLQRHLYSGLVLSVVAYALALWWSARPSLPLSFRTTLLATIPVLVIGSHYGASLTHGDDYLSGPEKEIARRPREPVTDSTPLFEAVIDPILEQKCQSCHRAEKAKGGLVMTDQALFIKGGKSGAAWVAHSPDSSLLIQRILLDLNDKKHMPPRGKAQLDEAEIAILHQWIRSGASFTLATRDLPPEDSLRSLSAEFMSKFAAPGLSVRTYDFAAADPAIIGKLNRPDRTIAPVAQGSPALHVSFFLRDRFQPASISECVPIQSQVVTLQLSQMPVTDKDLRLLAGFEHLEVLQLNSTDIKGPGLASLAPLTRLNTVSLSNTQVTLKDVQALAALPALRKVYLWNSRVDSAGIATLKQGFPQIHWDAGAPPRPGEVLQLTPPVAKPADKLIFAPGDSLRLSHPLAGARIIFTTDGSVPDSAKPRYFNQAIPLSRQVGVRARAVLPGWRSSETASFNVFLRGVRPDSIALHQAPDPKYMADGARSLGDERKGEAGNLVINWLGYREKPMEASLYFREPKMLDELILSAGINFYAHLFPPELIEVKGFGEDGTPTTIGLLRPPQPARYGPTKDTAYRIPLKKGSYNEIRLLVRPLASIPAWHSGKKQKAWVFVDEVFLHESGTKAANQ